MNKRKYDSETAQMVIQDFCNRQENLIMQEVFDFINDYCMDMKSLTSQSPELFELNKENIDDYIKCISKSGYHNRYIRIPKPLQEYLYVRDIVKQEVSKQNL